MEPVMFEAMIAPTATALRAAGKDGALRVTLEVSGEPEEMIVANAELYALIGKTFRVILEPFTPERFGTREDDE